MVTATARRLWVRKRNVGDRVVLYTPDNPRLHGAEATVEAVEEWGAHTSTTVAATGKYRALWEEMRTPRALVTAVKKEAEYTGEVCCNCQGSRLIRTGNCQTCADCGEPGGCG